jgi:hypothetical protein
MARKPSLSAALTEVAKDTPPPSAAHTTHAQKPAPSRTGKKTVAAHFDPAVSRQLRQLALEEDSSMQELLREAINDLFEKKGKPRLA